jgi:hypothetical protein
VYEHLRQGIPKLNLEPQPFWYGSLGHVETNYEELGAPKTKMMDWGSYLEDYKP